MTAIALPAIWLIIIIVGLPQLSETVYTPSLPDISDALNASESMVEYTLTLYLFGFALGTLFWGKLSDSIGRKPCILLGLFIFMIGCIGCYFSPSIEALLVSRFIQALGGSIGSVIGQAICRDSFQGAALSKVYSSVGSALAIFPAVGPVIGGFIAENFGWSSIFLFLLMFTVIISLLVLLYLPETHPTDNRQPINIKQSALLLLKDKNVLCFGFLVAACNGICFSYFAEGSFCLIKILGLSPSQYGLSFIAIAASTMTGGIISRTLHRSRTSHEIMKYGLIIISISSGLFSLFTLIHTYLLPITHNSIIGLTIISQMAIMFGICITTSNALSLALVNYKWCIGTASSLFGFFYYCLISLFTLGMGMLHNDTLLPMPLYFFTISLFMIVVNKMITKNS